MNRISISVVLVLSKYPAPFGGVIILPEAVIIVFIWILHKVKEMDSRFKRVLGTDIAARFETAVTELDRTLVGRSLEDGIVNRSVRSWLDADAPLSWARSEGMTADEWFFVTTLYGTMTPDGQRTHIRKFFPILFVTAANRDIRNFIRGVPAFAV